jgi:hypothetical protein
VSGANTDSLFSRQVQIFFKQNLDRRHGRETPLEISQGKCGISFSDLAFDALDRLPVFHKDEVHFSFVDISEIPKLYVSPFGILQIEAPLQQVARHEILKASPHITDNGPIKMIMLGLFLYGPNLRCSERIARCSGKCIRPYFNLYREMGAINLRCMLIYE